MSEEWSDIEIGSEPVSPTILEEILSTVLREQAFMFTENIDGQPDIPAPPFMRAHIRFDGPFDGALGLVFPHALGIELVANMMGLEPGDIATETEAETADALKELLNVVCGQFLAAAFGQALVFDLAIPSVTQIGAEQWQAQLATRDTTALLVEDEPVLFELSL